MIRLLSAAIQEEFDELLNGVRQKLRIISPFIGSHTAKKLADQVATRKLSAELITRFSRADFFKGVSSISGLQMIDAAGVKIKAVRNLHAKLYIIDSDAVVIGSSNFTDGGLIHNLEINLILEDETEIIQKAEKCFLGLYAMIEDRYIITIERIKEEKEFLDNLRLTGRGFERTFTHERDFGAIIVSDRTQNDIEQTIGEIGSIAVVADSWLKFEGLVENRLPGKDRVNRVRKNGIYLTRLF